MVVTCNSYPSRQTLENLDLLVSLYEVTGIPHTADRYKKLNRAANLFAEKVVAPTSPLTKGESDLIVSLSQPLDKQLTLENGLYTVTFLSQESIGDYPGQLVRMIYDAARGGLIGRRLWQNTYNKFYEYMPESTNPAYEVYRGVFFRFDIIDKQILLTIDPLTRIVGSESLWTAINKDGVANAQKRYVDRRFISEHGNKKSICILAKLDPSIPVNRESFTYRGKRHSVKSFLLAHRPALARGVSDDEPTASIYYSFTPEAKPYNTAPSLLKPIFTTDETPGAAKPEVYLTAERRRKLTNKFLTYLNPITLINGVELHFDKQHIASSRNRGVYDPPALVFGKRTVVKPSLNELAGIKRRKLKEVGPEHGIGFFGQVVVVHPREMSTDMAKKFYFDCKGQILRFFKERMPGTPRLWKYNEVADIRNDYNRFKDQITGLFVILRSSQDERYYEFKELFGDKPSQMITYRLANLRYVLSQDRMGIYWNKVFIACAGLLGKMGCRPWILGDSLGFDFNIGFDVGGTRGRVVCYGYVFDKSGRYLGIGRFSPHSREAISAEEMQEAITSIVREKLQTRISNIAIHRDGELRKTEIEGIKSAVEELISEGKVVNNPTVVGVNLKKLSPFRLFQDKSGLEHGCNVGSYLILDSWRALIATTGEPLLRQGIARPLLIEKLAIMGDAQIEDVARDIYYLTHLNWGSVVQAMKMPATVKYAEDQISLVDRGVFSKMLPL